MGDGAVLHWNLESPARRKGEECAMEAYTQHIAC